MTSETFLLSYPAVHPGTDTTQIFFHSGAPDLLSLYGNDGSGRRIFVTDTKIAALPALKSFITSFTSGKKGNDIVLTLETGEAHKTIESVLLIVKTALDANFSRNDTFVGIGGGVICDMTAFAAAIFKRGARVELVPTTLLAMVDAAVGGKTGCDFESYKNMIGAFFPAAVLHVFPQFVQSLDETQYRSGLAEAFKTALLYSAGSFSDFELKHEQIKTRDKATLDNIIRTCVKAKAKIVGQDFTERNIRMQLNFGHTFGHALETISGLGIVPHGDAVAWGIARALSLSANKGLCSAGYCNRVAAVMQKYGWETGPVHHTLKNSNAAADLLQAMKKDKKNTGRLIRVILQKGLCTTVIQEVPDDEILSVLR